MRNAFINTVSLLAKKNKNIVLLTGDLGYSVFDNFEKKFPKQFLNTGISEQNMTGVAAGMALEGKVPVIYSIIPFITMRNFEQIRNDICYQQLNVKIVGVGAGFSYGPYGYTHHPLEDIALMRGLPGMTVLSPGDPLEVELAVKAAFNTSLPTYIRLGKAGEKIIHKKTPRFTIGKGIILEEGNDITLIASGTLLSTAYIVTQKLRENNISVRLISFPTIKPLDAKIIIDSVKKTRAVFSIEEHSIIGGLGSAISEVIAESGLRTIFKRIGTPDKITHFVGEQEFMRKKHTLSSSQITNSILKLLSISQK